MLLLLRVCVCVCVLPVHCCPTAAPGDRYEVRVKYFHPMHFDTSTGRYVLDLPTVVPKVCAAVLWSCCAVLYWAVLWHGLHTACATVAGCCGPSLCGPVAAAH